MVGRAAMEQAVRISARRCLAEGVDRTAIAAALGVSRSHLYRMFSGEIREAVSREKARSGKEQVVTDVCR